MGQNQEEHQNLINNNNSNTYSYYNNGGYYIPPQQSPPPNYTTSITSPTQQQSPINTTITTTSTTTTTTSSLSSLPVIGGGNKYKYNNISHHHNSVVKIEKDPITNFFLPNLPVQLCPLISEYDYCEIIKQLNFYKQGLRVPKLYNLFTIIMCLIILGLAIYINIQISMVGLSLLPIILIIVLIHLFSYSRSKKIFQNEIKKYIEAINKHYNQYLFFNAINSKEGSLFSLEVYYDNNANNNINNININNNNNVSTTTPPNIYCHEMFYNFRYLQYVKSQDIQYYNGSVSTIDIIDVNNDESQPKPSLQKQNILQKQTPLQAEVLDTRPTQFYINNTSYYADDIKRPSIDELLTPSSAEVYYTASSSNNQK